MRRDAPIPLAALLLFVGSLLLASTPAGEERNAAIPEFQAKAAFLRNFALYIDWPRESLSESSFFICIFGDDPFGDLIDKEVEGVMSHERPIEVRRLRRSEEAADCQILFLSRTERRRQANLLAKVQGKPILTVGESDWFLNEGGGIRLVHRRTEKGGTRLVFEVNLKTLNDAGLKASSRMLSLAAVTVMR